MATADATGRTKREKIVKANPFLERFTVADLRTWADRKMRVPNSYVKQRQLATNPISIPVVLTALNNAVEILCNKIGVACFKS
jgi:hypothetical protein